MNYRRVNGGPLTTTAAFQDIPGCRLSATYGNGPLITLIHSTISNTGAAGVIHYQINIDGLALVGFLDSVPTPGPIIIHPNFLLTPNPGRHTYTLQAKHDSGGPYNLAAGNNFFTVIELPEWDETPIGNQD